MPRDESIDPFAQLERCHRRLEEACLALGPAIEARDHETVANIASFFARQITRHEDDEDSSLFPRLAKTAELRADLERLTAEHHAHAKLQTRLDDAVSGRLDADMDQWVELRSIADELTVAYTEHIKLEESRVFPIARAALSPDDVAAMRSEMDARRGR